MLRSLTAIWLNAALVLIVGWVAGRDFCLLHNAPGVTTTALGPLLLGLGAQIIGVFLIWALIDGRTQRILRTYVASNVLKAALLFLPFALVFLSHDLVAYALYNAGANNKIESARRVDSALRTCCLPWRLSK